MYLGFLLLGIGGLGAAAQAGWLTAPLGRRLVRCDRPRDPADVHGRGRFYYPLREGLEGTDKTPRLDDAELVARLDNRRPEALALIGGTGLLILIWLMTVKPG